MTINKTSHIACGGAGMALEASPIIAPSKSEKSVSKLSLNLLNTSFLAAEFIEKASLVSPKKLSPSSRAPFQEPVAVSLSPHRQVGNHMKGCDAINILVERCQDLSPILRPEGEKDSLIIENIDALPAAAFKPHMQKGSSDEEMLNVSDKLNTAFLETSN
jgi:hypothetical protein